MHSHEESTRWPSLLKLGYNGESVTRSVTSQGDVDRCAHRSGTGSEYSPRRTAESLSAVQQQQQQQQRGIAIVPGSAPRAEQKSQLKRDVELHLAVGKQAQTVVKLAGLRSIGLLIGTRESEEKSGFIKELKSDQSFETNLMRCATRQWRKWLDGDCLGCKAAASCVSDGSLRKKTIKWYRGQARSRCWRKDPSTHQSHIHELPVYIALLLVVLMSIRSRRAIIHHHHHA